MNTRRQAVPIAVRNLLERLGDTEIVRDFYLAGGTGLALLRAHRRSVDLNFFSRTNCLDAEGRRTLLAHLEHLPQWQLMDVKDGTVQGQVGSVRVSFCSYPEPLVRPLIRRGRIRLASLEDLGLMKLGAIIGRGSRKDFVDLYVICQELPLTRLLALGRRKFKRSHEFTLQALKALCFFEDAEQDPPVVTPVPVAWERVKQFFIHAVRVHTARYLRSQ